MAENKEHFRHIMLFYFRKGKNISQKKICAKFFFKYLLKFLLSNNIKTLHVWSI